MPTDAPKVGFFGFDPLMGSTLIATLKRQNRSIGACWHDPQNKVKRKRSTKYRTCDK